MKTGRKRLIWLPLMAFVFLLAAGSAEAVKVGQKAPSFELKDLNGRTFRLEHIKNPLVVLCFFAPFSKASEESIQTVQDLKTKYGDHQVLAMVVSKAPKDEIASFVSKRGIKLRVLVDTGEVSKRYGAEFILPTTYVLGPDMRILDKVQGGGESGVKLLVTLAEREMARKRVGIAKNLAEEAVKKSREDPKPKAIVAYAALKQGRIDEAEDAFRKLLNQPGEGPHLAKEGLAHVYWTKGDEEKAWKLAGEAGGRGSADVLKGDILYSRGKVDAALDEYAKATKKDTFTFQAAAPYNKLGRVYAENKSYRKADKLFENALEVDPYSIVALSNKGVIREKQGKWHEAYEIQKKAHELDPRDEISEKLLQRAEDMLKLAKDTKRAERIDRLVQTLVKRYRKNKSSHRVTDEWTSRPMVVAFLNMDEKGILTERAGIPGILADYLGAALSGTGRVQVVERALLDKLLAELNLGSSELSDRNTSLRLGRILAAKLLVTGMLIHEPGKSFLTLRIMDSETSSIPIVYANPVNIRSLNSTIHDVSSALLRQIVAKYPLQGYVMEEEGDNLLLNIGSGQGVKTGMKFALLEGSKPIKFKGKLLRRKLRKIGEIEISSVEPDVSYARVIEAREKIKKELKIKEIPTGEHM
ncbi:MAG: redoxin domain-containing protein [Desulfatiglandaceae bacterium]